MRLTTALTLTLAVIRGASAVCDCPDIAAQSANCDPQDSACLCAATSYMTALITCAKFRKGEDCSDQDLADATNAYNNLCSSLSTTSSDPATSTTTTSSDSTSTSDPTSSTDSDISTTTSASSAGKTTSSRTSTSSASRMAPTDETAASTSNNNQPVLTKAQIGGIAGGGAGLVLVVILITVYFTWRKYHKKDKKIEAERGVEAEKFVEGGRRMRAASMTLVSDRLYSTQRPLSYALGEYDSSAYEAHEGQQRGRETPDSTPPDSIHGNYFNRFSGSHVEDSAQAFINNNPQRSHYGPPSSYTNTNNRRSLSVNTSPAAERSTHTLPTASLSYEDYRNPHTDMPPAEEQSSLMGSPHRSASAPQRISRKPVGGSVHESRTSSDSGRQDSENETYSSPSTQYDSRRVHR
ncbi:hypothetical protein ABW21_db0207617 [Orbilia brochopaga]|nr:hypothetical protein ABW21_db0207617 [Drechslerella brochopaga]